MPEPTDALGVLATTRLVVDQAEHVRIDLDAVARTAEAFSQQDWRPPDWDPVHHWHDDPARTANYLLVLDALNFCFWDDEPRWRVIVDGERLDGYWALAAALTRAMRAGIPLDDAGYLAQITRDDLAEIFRGEGMIPLLDERVHNLREVGRVLHARYDGQFAKAIVAAGRSAVRLVELVVDAFPSFRDTARYRGHEVRFYKRAQILVGDIHGTFGGDGLGAFDDLFELTAFADYKVPQVLHQLGILTYTPALRERLAARDVLPAGSPEEIEIRAATVWGVEELRRAMVARGKPVDAYALDWMLWQAGQQLPPDTLPYHRTRTIYY